MDSPEADGTGALAGALGAPNGSGAASALAEGTAEGAEEGEGPAEDEADGAGSAPDPVDAKRTAATEAASLQAARSPDGRTRILSADSGAQARDYGRFHLPT